MLLLAYAALHAFPQVLFAYSVSERGITLYSSRPIAARAADRLARARDLIDRSELAVPGRSERVFLCNSPWLYRLFAPLSGGAFAVSMPATGHIFVAMADVDADLAYSQAAVYNRRTFSGLVAHEATHNLIRRRLGLWRASRLPSWVVEGYCDHVAGDGSFPEERGLRLIAAGESSPELSFRYFEHRRRVAKLIDEQGLSFEMLARWAAEHD
ncbi:hypothetical protein OJF2_59020 [Aquisphaera giovannonii]|uniref:DUF1570 domain-containing protein n=1 Tax=Aquisphaera giovannonii TaxID=406548 RepID=A0A5B9W9Q7_9BACT|nr:hypothetical protein [Aquisphaera giovannonii]QEH37312.1 hypothetical protein OJF2_59020 [Aquisphaera giovannonii]